MFLVLALAVIVLALAAGYAHGVRRLGAGPSMPALPEAPSPLQVRLLELDAALADLRALTRHLTPVALQMCAAGARARGPVAIEQLDSELGVGPGTQTVQRVLAAVQAIDAEDRRSLSDVGLEPSKLLQAIDAPLAPEPWVAELEHTLDYFRAAIRRLPDRRYG
jgi:hypothetical protein